MTAVSRPALRRWPRPPLAFAVLLFAAVPLHAAQQGDCTATVTIGSIGTQHPDPTRKASRTLTSYRYRIDVTASEKQCAVVDFNIRRSYKLPDGTPFTATEPATLRVRGGKGSQSGELPEKRNVSEIKWSAEDVSCRRCPP